jgi:hypothetical protein
MNKATLQGAEQSYQHIDVTSDTPQAGWMGVDPTSRADLRGAFLHQERHGPALDGHFELMRTRVPWIGSAIVPGGPTVAGRAAALGLPRRVQARYERLHLQMGALIRQPDGRMLLADRDLVAGRLPSGQHRAGHGRTARATTTAWWDALVPLTPTRRLVVFGMLAGLDRDPTLTDEGGLLIAAGPAAATALGFPLRTYVRLLDAAVTCGTVERIGRGAYRLVLAATVRRRPPWKPAPLSTELSTAPSGGPAILRHDRASSDPPVDDDRATLGHGKVSELGKRASQAFLSFLSSTKPNPARERARNPGWEWSADQSQLRQRIEAKIPTELHESLRHSGKVRGQLQELLTLSESLGEEPSDLHWKIRGLNFSQINSVGLVAHLLDKVLKDYRQREDVRREEEMLRPVREAEYAAALARIDARAAAEEAEIAARLRRDGPVPEIGKVEIPLGIAMRVAGELPGLQRQAVCRRMLPLSACGVPGLRLFQSALCRLAETLPENLGSGPPFVPDAATLIAAAQNLLATSASRPPEDQEDG